MKENKIHIGQMIQEQVEKQNIKVQEFAKLIHCVRENVYNIFASPTIDLQKLFFYGEVLNYDFIETIYAIQHDKKDVIELKNIEKENINATIQQLKTLVKTLEEQILKL